MPVSSVQYGQNPWQYANGLKITNDGTTPDEIIDIATGSILDSTGVYQLNVDSVLSPSISSTGLNGLDAGTVAANSVYAVYLVADPVTQQEIGAMFSLSLTGPLMPFGYSAFALIGFVVTDATSDILLGTWTAGNSSQRMFYYDAPLATAVTAGNATAYTAVSLAASVPAIQDTEVLVNYAFTPGAASRTLNLTPGNGVGNLVTITGQVTSVVVSNNVVVPAKVTSSVPEIDYKVANSGDAVAINVAGFSFNI
jgi:hypothetical protein